MAAFLERPKRTLLSCFSMDLGRSARFGGSVISPPVRETVFQQHRSAGDENSLDKNEQGRRAAYASQFLDPIGRAWRTKAKVKAALLGDEDPDQWDLPPKPKGMRRATYERWVARLMPLRRSLMRNSSWQPRD